MLTIKTALLSTAHAMQWPIEIPDLSEAWDSWIGEPVEETEPKDEGWDLWIGEPVDELECQDTINEL